MNRDPLSQMERGFAWSTGRRLAYSLPLPLAIILVIILALLSAH